MPDIKRTGGVPKGYRSPKVVEAQYQRRFWVAVLLRRLHSADDISNAMAKSMRLGKPSRATIIRDLRYLVSEGVAVRIKIGRFWKWYHTKNAPTKQTHPDFAYERAPNGLAKRHRYYRRKRLWARLRLKRRMVLDAVTETA